VRDAEERKYSLAEAEEISPKSRGGNGISTHSSSIFWGFRFVDHAVISEMQYANTQT
jgi:hypothetical protein